MDLPCLSIREYFCFFTFSLVLRGVVLGRAATTLRSIEYYAYLSLLADVHLCNRFATENLEWNDHFIKKAK